jgi:hypothetical protein
VDNLRSRVGVGSTLGSILAVAFGLIVVSTIALRSNRAAPSVAQVLYETEHPSLVTAQGAAPRGSDSTGAP